MSADERKIIADKIRGTIAHKVNFVFEQNDKAKRFGWSLFSAVQDAGVPLSPLPWEMPPGERLPCPVILHAPDGHMSSDPLCEALESLGVRAGRTSLTTLSLKMRTPTPLDIGTVFSPFPTGQSLPHDEYIVWVGEYSVIDDHAEFARRIAATFGRPPRDSNI